MQPRDLAAYMFLAIAWGFSFLVLLKVVHAFGWVGAVSLRALIASGTWRPSQPCWAARCACARCCCPCWW